MSADNVGSEGGGEGEAPTAPPNAAEVGSAGAAPPGGEGGPPTTPVGLASASVRSPMQRNARDQHGAGAGAAPESNAPRSIRDTARTPARGPPQQRTVRYHFAPVGGTMRVVERPAAGGTANGGGSDPGGAAGAASGNQGAPPPSAADQHRRAVDRIYRVDTGTRPVRQIMITGGRGAGVRRRFPSTEGRRRRRLTVATDPDSPSCLRSSPVPSPTRRATIRYAPRRTPPSRRPPPASRSTSRRSSAASATSTWRTPSAAGPPRATRGSAATASSGCSARGSPTAPRLVRPRRAGEVSALPLLLRAGYRAARPGDAEEDRRVHRDGDVPVRRVRRIDAHRAAEGARGQVRHDEGAVQVRRLGVQVGGKAG
ncbi:hypothetical protein THAOC_01279 [Thalassiosira oceanica]|uniref:Uncharacterized protein n=1 Tax=Thalassiosira oceanica TaxID=159749 RepID=K0THJ4_THAOC|nr:hypothetical protein THAOC_01279 [Thalassiosira oceanica]|eukprot:EJK76930.1 hypothetical protein THAOC_01279 [Thalassiosira oceanica]